MGTMLITQNLATSTLVAGKRVAVRLFFSSANVATQVDSIEMTILRPDGSRVTLREAPQKIIANSHFDFVGPSVVQIVPGSLLPWVGSYYFRARALQAGKLIAEYKLDRLKLLPTKDLRVMVARVWPGAPGTPQVGEVEAAIRAMHRFADLYPVRDGISSLDGDRTAGLRYNLDNNPEGPPHQDGNLCPLFQQWLNRPANLDSIDAAIAFRYSNAGDNWEWGARSGKYCGSFQFSGVVWGGFMANVFCQETGHCFGLEPPQDPYIDPGQQHAHALDPLITPLEAGLGFNAGDTQEWSNPLYDLMHWVQLAPNDDSIALNSWDWEYLREQLVKLPSTGPSETFFSWRNLEGHDLLPILATGKNADGRQFIFAMGGDRALYYRLEGQLEGSWDAWASLGGHALQQPIRVATDGSGQVHVFVLGGDGKLYARTQVGPNGAWAAWENIGGEGIKGDFAVAERADGQLEIVAVWNDGALHQIAQVSRNGPWDNWKSLGGQHLGGSVGLGKNADGRLEVFAVGGDGIIYYQWQFNANGQGGWSGWNTLNGPKVKPPKSERVAVIAGGDKRLYVFLMQTDHKLAYQVQDQVNATAQQWSSPIDLTGPLLLEPNAIWPCAVALNPDGRLEAFVVASDHRLYNQWQVDPARPDIWSDWVDVGGHDLQSSLAIGRDDSNELNVFVIGGDKKLYFADRGIEPDLSENTSGERIPTLRVVATAPSMHEGATKVWEPEPVLPEQASPLHENLGTNGLDEESLSAFITGSGARKTSNRATNVPS